MVSGFSLLSSAACLFLKTDEAAGYVATVLGFEENAIAYVFLGTEGEDDHSQHDDEGNDAE